MGRVKMAHGAAGVAGEDGNCRVLVTVAVLAAEVVFETAIASTEESQLVPAARARVSAQRRDIGAATTTKSRF